MVPESHINAGASGILAYPDTTSPQSPAIHSWAPATDSMFWKMEDSVEMEMEDRDGMCSPQDDNEYMEHARPRKRTRRACDKCSSSRTRCDGERPCRRCEDYGYKCHYDREIKRRGRLPTSMAASAKSNSNKSTPQQGVRSVPNGSSPASSVPSPNHMALQASQFSLATPPLRRGSMGRPAPLLGLNLPMAPSHALAAMTAPRSASFATPSCSYHAPHVHLQLSSLLDSSAEQPLLSRTRDSPPELPAASASDTSASYPSPANGVHGQVHTPVVQRSTSFGSNVPAGQARDRSSFSTSTAVTESVPELQQANFLFQAPSSDCRYRCLEPVLPYLRDILPASVACDLLDVYLTEPGSSLFKCASPYILTRVFRKQSLLHPTHPRLLTPALLATMLWTAAQTADIVMLHVPGSRSKITNALYDLATSLISDRDPDRWRRIHGGLCAEKEQPQAFTFSSALPPTTATNEPAGVIDDVLTFILLSIAVSGGDFKTDCFKWWNKATRLAVSLRLNREDEHCSGSLAPCVNPLCSCRKDRGYDSMAEVEAKEERRRVFWLLYCLDRHLALSFNTIIFMPDCYCEIYVPLPEAVWENLDAMSPSDLPPRVLGPPTVVTGTGFFEYFLPLMAILGDIIEVHHRRQHPRLGQLNDSGAVAVITELLNNCERSLEQLACEAETPNEYAAVTATPIAASVKEMLTGALPHAHHHSLPPTPIVPINPHGALGGGPRTGNPLTASNPLMSGNPLTGGGGGGSGPSSPPRALQDRSRLQLVTAYSMHILHVLHVLLHGKWDAISMLDNDNDDWITTGQFHDCASHAIAASQAVEDILQFDPELTFMPYLFGIYLLHGSFILLLFADRMPQLGPNQSVEQACETIIRAHEVCVVTLSTEFQKNFRKVLRSTLYSVRGSSPAEWEEHMARRRALSLYRWTKGAKGLGL